MGLSYQRKAHLLGDNSFQPKLFEGTQSGGYNNNCSWKENEILANNSAAFYFRDNQTAQLITRWKDSLHVFSSKLIPNVKSIVIYTSYRCGSSFTGEIFKQNSNVYYLFEPDKLTTLVPNKIDWQKAYNHTYRHIASYIKYGMHCNYTDLYHDGNKLFPNNQNVTARWLKRIFEQPLKQSRRRRFTWSAVIQQCQKQKVRVMKILRAQSLASLIPVMKEHIYVINLIRHPIGMALSRLNIDAVGQHQSLQEYLKSEENIRKLQNEVLKICKKYDKDIKFVLEIGTIQYHKVMDQTYRLIRYEDMARKPIATAKLVYKFLGIDWSERVEKWINVSTKEDSI